MKRLRLALAALGRFKVEAIQVAGISLVAYGLYLIYPPAAAILAGAALFVIAELKDSRGKREGN